MNKDFSQNSYNTPENTGRSPFDKMMMGSRWFFHGWFIKILSHYRKRAQNGEYDLDMWTQSSLEIMHAIERCGGRFSITGLDHIRNLDKPVVFVSNHMSTLETMIFPALLRLQGESTFVVKKSLIENSFFGPIMRSRNPIALERVNPRQDLKKVLTEGCERLSSGTSIVVFPQSTREVRFDAKKFNTLGIKLAQKAGVPVVPVAIKTDFWENGRLLKTFGPLKRDRTIYMTFGAPLDVPQNSGETHREIISFITSELEKFNTRS